MSASPLVSSNSVLISWKSSSLSFVIHSACHYHASEIFVKYYNDYYDYYGYCGYYSYYDYYEAEEDRICGFLCSIYRAYNNVVVWDGKFPPMFRKHPTTRNSPEIPPPPPSDYLLCVAQ